MSIPASSTTALPISMRTAIAGAAAALWRTWHAAELERLFGAPDARWKIVEAFRFPADFDQDSIPVFNTNTLLFDAEAIDRDFDLTWFAVTKQVGGKPAIQFEHLVGELSAFLPSTFLRVEREGADAA